MAQKLSLEDGETQRESKYIIICETNHRCYGISVDKVFDTEEVIVKPLPPVLRHIGVYSGMMVVGDGSVEMIIDPYGLAGNAVELFLQAGSEESLPMDMGRRFLVFMTGSGSMKALPLTWVERLEKMDAGKVVYFANGPVIHYQGKLISLVQLLGDAPLPKEGFIQVVICADQDKTIGLVVGSIIDVIAHAGEIEADVSRVGSVGSIVVGEAQYDLPDMEYYFRQSFPERQGDMAGNLSFPQLLLVDDSTFFRKFIPPALVAAGYHVTTAGDPQEALKLLAKDGKRFAAIITDMNMPGMNGAEFAKHCKNDNNLAHIPVLALTSQPSEQVADHTDNGILSGYVAKTNHSELIAALSRLLSETMQGVA